MMKSMCLAFCVAVHIIWSSKSTLGMPTLDSFFTDRNSAHSKTSLTHESRNMETVGGIVEEDNYIDKDNNFMISPKNVYSIPITDNMSILADTTGIISEDQRAKLTGRKRHKVQENVIVKNKNMKFGLSKMLTRSVITPGYRIKRVVDITGFSKRIVVPNVEPNESIPSRRSRTGPEDSETAPAQSDHWPVVSSNNQSAEGFRTFDANRNGSNPPLRVGESDDDLQQSAISQLQPNDSSSLTDVSEPVQVIHGRVRDEIIPNGEEPGVQPGDTSETNGAEAEVLAGPLDMSSKEGLISEPAGAGVVINDTQEVGHNDNSGNSDNNNNTNIHIASNRSASNDDVAVTDSDANSGNGSISGGHDGLDHSLALNNASSHAIVPATAVALTEPVTTLYSTNNIVQNKVGAESTSRSLEINEATLSFNTQTIITSHAPVALVSATVLSSTKISSIDSSFDTTFSSPTLQHSNQPITTSRDESVTMLSNEQKPRETSEINMIDVELNNEGESFLTPSDRIVSSTPSHVNPSQMTFSTNYLSAEKSSTGVSASAGVVPATTQVPSYPNASSTVPSSSLVRRSSTENSADGIQINQRNTTMSPEHPAGDPPAVIGQRPEAPDLVLPAATTTTTQTTASDPEHPHLQEGGTESKTSRTTIGITLNSTAQTSAGSNSGTDSNVVVVPPYVTGKTDVQFTTSDNVTTNVDEVTSGTASPSPYMELKFGMSWPDFCQQEVSIRGELVQILHERSSQAGVTVDQIQIMEPGSESCTGAPSSGIEVILVRMYLMNKSHQFDRELTLVCYNILKSGFPFGNRTNSSIKDTLLDITVYGEDLGQGISSSLKNDNGSVTESSSDSSNDPRVIIAVVLAVVGGCCCIGLISIQVIIRRRNKENRPINSETHRRYSHQASSDIIQLTSVIKSRPNSGLYNPGLELVDNVNPSNPLNYVQLSNFCSGEGNIAEEFQKLPQLLPRPSIVPTGEEDKNRYANVLPLLHTRVKLTKDSPDRRSSYINANYVTGPNRQCQAYIATQAPTDKTTTDFWTMVWQQGCRAIVMLTQIEEQGQRKCANYWPELVGKSAAHRYGDFQIELKQKDVHQEYILSRLEINNLRKIETRELDHFWYTCWPPNGLPEPISLVKLVLDVRPKYETGCVPLLVHCSPGTGRTCTFIALDLCMRQFEKRRIVNVLATVHKMRQERAGAIQNKEQYSLLYNALCEYATIVMTPGISAASSAATLQALLSG